MDDAGEHRRFRIEMRHLAGDDMRQGRDVRVCSHSLAASWRSAGDEGIGSCRVTTAAASDRR
jgi:hypothetical protein